MEKKMKTSMSGYELWNKIGCGFGYFFAALAFILTLDSSTMNETYVILCLVLSILSAIVVLYNDYRFQKYAKIVERLLAFLAVLILAVVYWYL